MPTQPDDGPVVHLSIVADDINIPNMRPLKQPYKARKKPTWMNDFVTNVAFTSFFILYVSACNMILCSHNTSPICVFSLVLLSFNPIGDLLGP